MLRRTCYLLLALGSLFGTGCFVSDGDGDGADCITECDEARGGCEVDCDDADDACRVECTGEREECVSSCE